MGACGWHVTEPGGGARGGGHSQQRRARQARRGCLEILGDPGRETVASAGWQGAHPETPEPGGGVILTGAPEGPGGPRGPMGPWGERDNSVMAGGETRRPPPPSPAQPGVSSKMGTVPTVSDAGSPMSQDETPCPPGVRGVLGGGSLDPGGPLTMGPCMTPSCAPPAFSSKPPAI